MFKYSAKTSQRRLEQGKVALRHFFTRAILEVGTFDTSAVTWVCEGILRYSKENAALTAPFTIGGKKAIRSFSECVLEEVLSTCSGQQEFRLNRAGLKLYLSIHKGKVEAYIGGDQASQYWESYPVLTMILWEEGLLPDDRVNFQPMSQEWMINHWQLIDDWGKDWILERVEDLPEGTRKGIEEHIVF